MNRIDGSAHVEIEAAGQAPSLLTIILDTNPRAWATLRDALPFASAVSSLLVYVNAHLAFGNDNQVAILAAHTERAVWLYPQPPANNARGDAGGAKENGAVNGHNTNGDANGDVRMGGTDDDGAKADADADANKYNQFSAVEASLSSSLRQLIAETPTASLPPTTLIAGALSQALAHTNKTALVFAPSPSAAADPTAPKHNTSSAAGPQAAPNLHARILIVSASDTDPSQYIPTMNAVFAAAHARVPIDTVALSPYCSPTFLQQASVITGGVYLSAAANPRAFLTYLMFGLLPDADARRALVAPAQGAVDFRAACFCHRRVVDTGFVCSVCLSIFCEPPPDAECLTCGTKLALGNYGAKPAVVPRKKSKKKRRPVNGAAAADGRENSGSAAGTPIPG